MRDDSTPRIRRTWLGVRPCCLPRELWFLFVGVTIGWVVLFRPKEGRLALRWLYWKCWYWPGYATGGYDELIPCKHNTLAKRRNP